MRSTFARLALAASTAIGIAGCGGSSPSPATADMAQAQATGDMAVAPDLAVDKPNAPSNLNAVPLGGGAHLTWKDKSSDEDGFMIMRKEGMGAFMMVNMVPFNTTAYHDAPLTSGKTYTYMVHAMKGDTLSDPSNQAMVTIP